MPIRKHRGINQKTGRLKKGYTYSNQKLKSGLKKIIKVQKGGQGILKKKPTKPSRFKVQILRDLHFDENVNVKKIPKNDCPATHRVRSIRGKSDGRTNKLWSCNSDKDEYTTATGFRCCKKQTRKTRKTRRQ